MFEVNRLLSAVEKNGIRFESTGRAIIGSPYSVEIDIPPINLIEKCELAIHSSEFDGCGLNCCRIDGLVIEVSVIGEVWDISFVLIDTGVHRNSALLEITEEIDYV